MLALKVPFALNDEQAIISAEIAKKEQRYFCPACGSQVILKKGQIKIAHFAHKVEDQCSEETIIHQTAKRLIQQIVMEWKNGRVKSPIIERNCKICDTIHYQPLPDKVDSALIEYKLNENYIVDIALAASDQVVAAIEIRVTHAVDTVKSSRLSIPFIELSGIEVLKQPNQWKPIVDKLRPFRCPTCADNMKLFKEKISEIAATNQIVLPISYYRYSFNQCWKCKQPTLVFTWPGQIHGRVPNKEPRPRVIQFRFSNTIKSKYWANVCLHCNSLQGDNYLYSEPDGPFFGFECGKDTSEDFQEDLMKLAYYAHYIGLI